MTLFDSRALDLARDRATRRDPSFLDARLWDEMADAVALLSVKPRMALLLGPLTTAAQLFAHRMKLGLTTDLDHVAGADLIIAARWAESEDDLPEKLAAIAHMAPPDTPLLGASIGGDSLAALRTALLAADAQSGAVVPRAHPRIEPGAFAELLQRAGFVQPVVDVDRVEVRYSSLGRLVDDLRDLGATNVLAARSRAVPPKAWRERLLAALPPGTVERFDLLFFSAWTGSR